MRKCFPNAGNTILRPGRVKKPIECILGARVVPNSQRLRFPNPLGKNSAPRHLPGVLRFGTNRAPAALRRKPRGGNLVDFANCSCLVFTTIMKIAYRRSFGVTRGLMLLTLMILIAAGCVPAYHKSAYYSNGERSSGYSDQKISSDQFIVEVEGADSREQAKDFVHLHASEICLQNGFRFYSILSDRSGGGAVFSTNLRQSAWRSILILCYVEESITNKVIEATKIQQSIKQKYGMDFINENKFNKKR